MRRKTASSSQVGYTLVELLVVVAIIGILAATVIPQFQRALLKAKIGRLAKSAKTLYLAFLAFNVDHSVYPSTVAPPERAFDRMTLFPLVDQGYLRSTKSIVNNLHAGQITSYDSPNTAGPDAEFWAIMTLKEYPAVQIVVADTSEFPGFGGTTISGAYFILGSELLNLDEDILKQLGK